MSTPRPRRTPGGRRSAGRRICCTLLEPMVATCWSDETTLTDEDSAPLLGRLAAGLGTSRRCSRRSATAPAAGAPCWCSGGPRTSPGPTVSARRCPRSAVDSAPWPTRSRDGAATRRLVEELMRLDQYRRDLVASITHDLKTPLTAIALNAELLESDGRLAEAGSHPVGGDPPERRPAVEPGRRPARHGSRRGGRRQPHRGRPGRRCCATRATTPRPRHVCVGSPSTSTPRGAVGRRRRRTLWRVSSPTWSRTR